MLANVFTKSIRDRWFGWMVAMVSLISLLVMAMAAYREMDVGIYAELPEVYRSLIGISESADVASLSINALVGSYGAMTIAAMAIAMGAAAIAGEERNGTIGLLLGNPKSRTRVALSKAAAMVVLTAAGVLVLWGAVYLTAGALGVSIEGMDVGALFLHLYASSLFYGFLATAVGAWTGNRGVAASVAAGVMVLSFVAVGVLPLIEGAEDYVRAFPWHYFTGSSPLLNGIDWSHIGVLLGASGVFTVATVIGVNRRDLRSQSVGTTLFDRLRANQMAKKLFGRLSGSARVSSIWFKTASEYQTLFLVTAVYMITVQGLMMGPMYAAIPKETLAGFEAFPETMLVLFGGGKITTPEGFYQLETFGMMAPIAIMIVAIAVAAGAMAGEESHRTMGLLLANPVRRSRLVLEKSFAMVLLAAAIGIATFIGVALGSIVGNLEMNISHIAATCLLQTLVGIVFGALALALSAGTGRTKIAVFGAIGAGVSLHLLNSFAQLNDSLAKMAKWSPFYYYLGNDPLMNGMNWGHAAVLVGLSAVLIALSVVLFQRRDTRG